MSVFPSVLENYYFERKTMIYNILGVIPARYASSRFPGKPLIDLKGKSMIQRVYEGAKQSKLLNEIIVATDDERIFSAVSSFGGKVEMTSEHHTSGTDRCGEILSRNQHYDIVLNIQGDEPLVSADQIDQLLSAFEDENVLIATLGIADVSKEDKHNPNRIKLVKNKNSDALYFSRSAIPNEVHCSKEVAKAFPFMRHIGLYAYRSKVLKELVQLEKTELEKVESLEQLRWLFHGYAIRIVETKIETPNIDAPEDVDKVLDLL
jgi:3-deoxy-manno-octulosonate cytidylyltransferase (CMP-KDO synthetase)